MRNLFVIDTSIRIKIEYSSIFMRERFALKISSRSFATIFFTRYM